MSDGEVFPVPAAWAAKAQMTAAGYAAACAQVESDPDGYWREVGQRLDWSRPFTQVKDVSFDKTDFRIRWYADGTLNVSVNCLDRHLATRGDQTALIWESDSGDISQNLSYRELHTEVHQAGTGKKTSPLR